MTSAANPLPLRSTADYGIDAPGLVRGFFAASLAMIALAVVVRLAAGSVTWASWVSTILLTAALYPLGMACLMVYWSKFTKVRERDYVLDLLTWRGDEQILDVGCGRGLMLIGAARRLSAGQAIGIDIWQASDQSVNRPEAAIENARIEGVADRVEVRTADMRAMPFADATFDVVLSQWAVHNLYAEHDRQQALAEMTRVLKRDGKLVLGDIVNRDAYAAELGRLGFAEQTLIVSPIRDRLLRAISFGSFGPCVIIANRPRTH